jgi:tyrosyl-tRNA synthetase
MKENLNLIKRGIDELISEEELLAKLKSKKPLIVKLVLILLHQIYI